MNANAVIAIAAGLGLAVAGTAVYLYEAGQPISITLAPSTANNHITTSSLPRKVGQKVTLNLPPGGTWAAAGSTGAGLPFQVGGSSPITYTMNATDTALNLTWMLNGVPYVNIFNFA